MYARAWIDLQLGSISWRVIGSMLHMNYPIMELYFKIMLFLYMVVFIYLDDII
jgi:hypothetical protein